MAEFIMLVGLPGSGKSTFAEAITSHIGHIESVSSDSIRKELYGSEEIQDNPARVFEIARDRVVDILNSDRSAILDATNLVAKKRISFIQDIKARVSKPFSCRAIIVCPTLKKCIERDSGRDRTVGKEVIDRMVRSFQYPQKFEGFDYIELMQDTTSDLCPEFYNFMWTKARDFDQNTPYHKYRLYDHCMKVATQFESDDPRHLAGIIHDVGKLYTRVTDENGVSHYYNHESVGAYVVASEFSSPYVRRGEDLDILNEIIFYVNYHMHIRDIIKSEKAVKKYKQLWGEDRFNKLVEFMEADNKASGREV
jgi:predicted kinase